MAPNYIRERERTYYNVFVQERKKNKKWGYTDNYNKRNVKRNGGSFNESYDLLFLSWEKRARSFQDRPTPIGRCNRFTGVTKQGKIREGTHGSQTPMGGGWCVLCVGHTCSGLVWGVCVRSRLPCHLRRSSTASLVLLGLM